MMTQRPRIQCLVWLAMVLVHAANADTPPKIRVLLPEHMATAFKEDLAVFQNLELVPYASVGEMASKLPDCDGVIGEPDESLVKGAPRLRWIQIRYAGMEGFPWLKALGDHDLVVTNCKIIMGPQLADHAMALLLTLTRNLRFYSKNMDDGAWRRLEGMPLLELHGKTMLIVGFGGAGVDIAERAAAFDMHVLAVDPKDIPYLDCVEYTGKPDELMKLLPQADVVVSAAPMTDETRNILGTAQFAAMKKGAFVINISRGGLIDTDALAKALQSGHLAGAGLDVTEPEPLAPDHPLWKMSNVIITPHVAGLSDGRDPRIEALAKDNIGRFAQGLPLKNVVDGKRGY